MTFSSAVTTTTREMIVPKVYDTVTKGSTGLMTFLQRAKSWKSGTKYQFPIKFADTTNGGNIGIADQLDTSRQNVRVMASFDVKGATKPVTVANIETTLNQGDEQIVDLLDTEFDSQAQSLMNLMAQNLYTGNGSGNEWDSLANAADDGTNYNVYGGLSRTTYTSFKGYYIASVGALSLTNLATAFDAVSVGVDTPDLIFTTKTLWSKYESLLASTVRANFQATGFPKMNSWGLVPASAGISAEQGFQVVYFRGTPIARDEQIPSGKVFLVNTKYFSFKGVTLIGNNIKTLNFKNTSESIPAGVPGNVPSTKGFNFRDFMSPVDQLAEIGHLIYMGNFISENPRLQGQMVGVTA